MPPYGYTVNVRLCVQVLPRESVTVAVTVTLPDIVSRSVVKLALWDEPMLGEVVIEYEVIVEPFTPCAPCMLIVARLMPCAHTPQLLRYELVLTGDMAIEPIVGALASGACTVNEYVFWPIIAPSEPIVLSFTVAVPLDDDGIADSHEVGIVYDVDVTPAATDCV